MATRPESDYKIKKSGDNYALYYKGENLGVFATRKTAEKYKRIEIAARGPYRRNPSTTRVTSSPLLPAKVRINPRTGKVQVFVSPKVAAQVKQRGNPARGMSTTSYTVYLDKGAKVFGYKEQAKKFAQQRANETGLSVGIYQNLKGGRFGSITTVRPKR